MTFRHGLVVGKFYPPHVGHELLIRRAAEKCLRVTVVVAASTKESLSLGDRVEWLAWSVADLPHVAVVGRPDGHPIDYQDDAIWRLHMEVFRAAVSESSPGVPVDVVFSGEDYGDELARRFGAAHVRVDRSTSATSIRADLKVKWLELVPAAREGLARRIVVLGAESTGTTTLAIDLAHATGAGFVPEFGRTFSAAKLARARESVPEVGLNSLTWTSAEFTWIASRQQEEIRQVARRHPVVIADTDALATSVWHERYVGGQHEPSLELARRNPPHLYVLTSEVGVAFEDDGLRDGEHVRESMSSCFREALEATGVPWLEVSGAPAMRVARVLEDRLECFSLPHLSSPLA